MRLSTTLLSNPFQLGEVKEAEMTILEAIRHNPFDLNTRLDYLRIARGNIRLFPISCRARKSKELFPDSSEILWELARRYHLVEKMPVTAGILYRKVINITAEGVPRYTSRRRWNFLNSNLFNSGNFSTHAPD